MAEFALSKHAIERALDMALEPDEIRDAVLRPRETYWSVEHQSEWRTRGRITACMAMSPLGVLTVKTFLWAKASGWVADQEIGDGGTYAGRYGDTGNVRAAVRARRRNR